MAYTGQWLNAHYQFGEMSAELILTDGAGVRPQVRIPRRYVAPLASFTAAFRNAEAVAIATAVIAQQNADAAEATRLANALAAIDALFNDLADTMQTRLNNRAVDALTPYILARVNPVIAVLRGGS